ncbi:tetratricopeptide repeat-containing sulfotransferase family protein [Pseudoalteromonas phenolica]|uniref:tetratricopeptide repeat-containing sulfotransferase family protein n=1 Tax=Pseudoalteromonas phenolica TaxID=161398 RepID=UPI00110AD14A|nr:sulfotransferase [Pseudoalteromonas phenolica]TMO52519.1 protein-tyrosine sulfotransferase [Pseudoalteromonas phenolica]
MLLLKRANELLEQGKLREAEFMFKAVLKENNKIGPALFGLGRICMRLEDYDSAIYYLKRACEHLPKMLDPLFALADAFMAVGSSVDAKTVLEYTLSVAKHNAQAHYQLGLFYLDHGFIENAERTFEAGLACPPSAVTAFMLHELIQISATNKLEAHIEKLHSLLTEYDNKRLKIVVYYSLAKCNHRLNDHNQAFDYFKLANELQLSLCEFKTADMSSFFDALKDQCSDDFFSQPNDKVKATFTPTFIVGLPRTGSTLLEQMLVQHSNIGSMGESTIISDKIVPYLQMRNEAPFPECLHTLTTSMLDHCRSLYVDEIKKHRVGEEVVINKLPANFQNIGLIQKIFPDARIVHLTRSFNANAWSVYSNHFAENEPYFCSLTEYKQYADFQEEMMAHFKHHLPRNIYTLSYENLLDETPKELNKLLNFLYQKFEPECLEFYKSKRPVSTLSKAQVRKPLDQGPRSNWQVYEKQIMAILDAEQTTLSAP